MSVPGGRSRIAAISFGPYHNVGVNGKTLTTQPANAGSSWQKSIAAIPGRPNISANAACFKSSTVPCSVSTRASRARRTRTKPLASRRAIAASPRVSASNRRLRSSAGSQKQSSSIFFCRSASRTARA